MNSEERNFEREKRLLDELELRHKDNYIKSLYNGMGEKLNDPTIYIKRPRKFKILINRIKEIFRYL